MKEKALSEDEVMRILEETRECDFRYDRFFSTMCTQPHPIAVRAHNMFLETNLGDPGLFPGVADLEQRVVRMLGEMLGCPNAAG
jgi:tyrosine decarboxylase / aspartate 1-decarboxylase